MMQRKKQKGFYKIFSQLLLTWNGIIGKMLTYMENVDDIRVTKMVDEIIFNI